MSKIILVSQDRKTLKRKVTLPVVGDVHFHPETNSIEVDEDKADELLSKDFGIQLVREEKGESEETSEEKEETSTKEMLEALSEPELKELLISYPVQETKRLSTTDKIIAYLAKKMK